MVLWADSPDAWGTKRQDQTTSYTGAHDRGAAQTDTPAVARGAGGFTASPWAYNGRIFVLSEEGDTYVLDTEDSFRVVATNSLGEVAMSSPAIARGSLFIRTRSHLWRLTDTSRAR